jgi:ribA/ribD-fused uncharacterized protein
MLKALKHKFKQNHELAKKLLDTGTSQLVEASPRDSYWGSGADGQGLNKLGQLLMIIREQSKDTDSLSKIIAKIPIKLKIPIVKTS